MTAVVNRWTGQEVLALRKALRRNQVDFAAAVGISQRMLRKWENGTTQDIRPTNQRALDTMLATAGAEAQERFAAKLTEQAAAAEDVRTEQLLRREARYVKSPVDGKLMVPVEEGVYLAGPGKRPTWVEAFLIDVYPTTNADYQRFVRATRHRAPQHWPGGRCPDSIHDHPVVWVTWNDAAAYAAWAGKTLPASAQWEKAARGARGRIYPWGDAPTAAKCNVQDSGIGRTTPVTRYQSGVSEYGVFDLCGNVWEWCATETEPGRYELKGSAFTSPFTRAAPSLLNDADDTMFDNDTGFRCAAPG
ncbi:MAG: SUMF1/EgtB/PvdO family nonheme iron enzyme [Streptomyces sp.]|nr:SUMF1/EgtB/PvdO family nonheme iron enzyme [Streptomyces sp.]NUS11391.1 SUMF1/EgtB/PvdO family nonheme iron enzyme [Streptomyces sp.]NUS23468.1 SUMF1/EgtB/PvdO family nonheme iron enzyme [Streptomyces sp.]